MYVSPGRNGTGIPYYVQVEMNNPQGTNGHYSHLPQNVANQETVISTGPLNPGAQHYAMQQAEQMGLVSPNAGSLMLPTVSNQQPGQLEYVQYAQAMPHQQQYGMLHHQVQPMVSGVDGPSMHYAAIGPGGPMMMEYQPQFQHGMHGMEVLPTHCVSFFRRHGSLKEYGTLSQIIDTEEVV